MNDYDIMLIVKNKNGKEVGRIAKMSKTVDVFINHMTGLYGEITIEEVHAPDEASINIATMHL